MVGLLCEAGVPAPPGACVTWVQEHGYTQVSRAGSGHGASPAPVTTLAASSLLPLEIIPFA